MKAPGFAVLGVDGKRHSPASARGEKGLVVMFICNHCPYVKKSIERIVNDCQLLGQGIGSIAIMPNDPAYNAEDSFEKRVARAYDAVCTPEFFGFDSNLELVQAMTVAAPAKPINAIGCSIKWKARST
jgi:hypothetical protein